MREYRHGISAREKIGIQACNRLDQCRHLLLFLCEYEGYADGTVSTVCVCLVSTVCVCLQRARRVPERKRGPTCMYASIGSAAKKGAGDGESGHLDIFAFGQLLHAILDLSDAAGAARGSHMASEKRILRRALFCPAPRTRQHS